MGDKIEIQELIKGKHDDFSEQTLQIYKKSENELELINLNTYKADDDTNESKVTKLTIDLRYIDYFFSRD